MNETKKRQQAEWVGLLKTLDDISKMETKVDSRIRILIKNMFTVRENGWEKELEEGPLKLKDLHKKVRQEQEYGEYEDYDETKKKKKKEERKSKVGGSKHFGKSANH